MKKLLLSLILTLGLCVPVFAQNSLTVIDQHKGLQRNPKADKIEDGAHSKFDNVYIKDQNINIVKGRDRLNSTANVDTTVNGLTYYEAAAVIGDCDTCEILLSFDGTDESTTITDDTSNHSPTTNNDAELETSAGNQGPKFGTASVLLDGTGDYVSIPDSSDFFFGTDDFTIDFWINYDAKSGTRTLYSQRENGSNFIEFRRDNSGPDYELVAVSGGSTLINASWRDNSAVSNGVWLHVELTRDGNEFIVRDGGSEQTALSGTTDSDAMPDISAEVQIGCLNALTCHEGRIDEFRIDKGTNYHPDTQDFNQNLPNAPYTISNSSVQKLVVAESDDVVTYDTDGTNRTVILSGVSDRTWDFLQVGEILYLTNTSDGLYKWNGSGTAAKNLSSPNYPYIEEYKGVAVLAEGRNLRFSDEIGEDLTDGEIFGNANHIIVGTDEHIVTALKKTSDSLLIFTEGSIQELTGFGASTFRLRNLASGFGAIRNETIEEDGNGDIIFFSGVQGVYKLRVGNPLTDSNNASILDITNRQIQRISSPRLDDVFRGDDSQIDLDPNDYTSSHAYYDSENDLYHLYIDEHDFIYDNANGTWSHLPATEMTASTYALSTIDLEGTAYLLDNVGFFYENWTGYENGIESGTVTGSPTSSTSTTLVDTGATFNTTDDGLTGLWVFVDNEDGEYRQISSNTATELTVSPAWTNNPITSDDYYVAYIIPDWETKQYQFDKAPRETHVHDFWVIHNKSDSTQELEFFSFEDKSTTAVRFEDFDLKDNFIDKIGNPSRANWIQWGFRSFVYNTSDTINIPVDIISYAIEYEIEEER